MANPELGLKRICVSCNTRFYDLNRTPAICPKCDVEQPHDLPQSKRADETLKDQVKSTSTTDDDIDVDLGDDEDADPDVIEDTSDLDDDDDLGAEIEVNTVNDDSEN